MANTEKVPTAHDFADTGERVSIMTKSGTHYMVSFGMMPGRHVYRLTGTGAYRGPYFGEFAETKGECAYFGRIFIGAERGTCITTSPVESFVSFNVDGTPRERATLAAALG